MALLSCRFKSEVLALSTSLQAIIPDGQVPPRGHPTLYLLHGLSDDDSAWVRLTGIERHARARGLAVIMPQVHRSFYADEKHGGQYWTFLTRELPELCGRIFHLSTERRDVFVAGLSMGGYGALKWALSEPMRFSAAASFSGALGLAGRPAGRYSGLDDRLWDTIFDGADVSGSPDDLLWLLGRLAPGQVPPLWVSCGTEDPMLSESLDFIAAAERMGIDLVTDLGPGEHTWDYWDEQISRVVGWLPLPG